MKKNYDNKSVEGADENQKAKALLCLRECVMPGLGHFKQDEIITDSNTISKIADNPNFIPKEE